MKMVKSLLLGSAAGLVAVSAGQAADLPVKAKPVEYVRVCNLYGAGFFYLPGTDVCIKLGGFLRTEWDIHAAGSFAPNVSGANGFQFRAEDNYVTRARALLSWDVREQTGYGTLRAYAAAGWQYTTDDAPTVSLPGTQSTGTTTQLGAAIASTFTGGGNSNLYMLRAFIQWGGFTFGKTASFFDFFNTSKYSLQTNFLYQDFGGFGVFTYGYTQQLGNGLAVTVAAQDPSQYEHQLVNLSGVSLTATTSTTATLNNVFLLNAAAANNNVNAGTLVPDIVGSIRIDQAWGGAQVAGILHDNRATYYTTSLNGEIAGSSEPSDKWGWAVMGGLELNTPYFGKSDSFAVQSQYCVGASMDCYNNSGTRFNDVAWSLVNVNKIGLGWLDDGFVANTAVTGATGLQLATNWNVWAAYQHYWVPELRTSLYGGYAEYHANSSAIDTLVCQALNTGTGFFIGGTAAIHLVNGTHVSSTGCADWEAWTIGSRTLWNPVKNLDIGVDVLYTAMAKSAFGGGQFAFAPGGGAATQTLTAGDTHIWAGILRVQYNFIP
jgi:Porin subfamily